jgi:hypothetical protein
VQSASAPLRSMCAASLLHFLLDWPLEERRLKQHLEAIVANLGYAYEDGRLQVCCQPLAAFQLQHLPSRPRPCHTWATSAAALLLLPSCNMFCSFHFSTFLRCLRCLDSI